MQRKAAAVGAGRIFEVAAALGHDHGRDHLGVFDDIFEFGRAQIRIDRHHGNAEAVERKPVTEERRTIFQKQADALAGAVSGFGIDPKVSAAASAAS
jgi:hypothetical protein